MINSNSNDCPNISVLISCYNGERWLTEAINSILIQSYKSFELILINDGSTDNTWSIIEKFSFIDKRIVPINKNNTGLANSLNLGVSIAKGKWIARLDQDDISEPTRLEEQLNFVQLNPNVILLGTGFIEITMLNKFIKKHSYPTRHQDLLKNLERSRRFFPHSSAFFRTDIVKEIGGYNNRIQRAEDRFLWLNLSSKGKIACISKPLVRIRKHSEQMSLDNNGLNQLHDSISVEICHFLKKSGYQDPSNSIDINDWFIFHNWVQKRLSELGVFNRRNSWLKARNHFYANDNRLYGILVFINNLIKDRYVFSLIIEYLFGSAVAQKLARQWILYSNNIIK